MTTNSQKLWSSDPFHARASKCETKCVLRIHSTQECQEDTEDRVGAVGLPRV